MESLTQWAPADAVGARQLRLGDLAAWSDFAFDDGSLDTPEDVFRKRLAFFHYVRRGLAELQHIVDTLNFNSHKTS